MAHWPVSLLVLQLSSSGKPASIIWGIYEIIPGFIFCSIAIIIVSLFGKKPTETMTTQFEKADEAYHEAMVELRSSKTGKTAK